MSDGIYETAELGGVRKVIRCTDCKNWVDAETGGVVRHSKRCDHSKDNTIHGKAEDLAPAAARAVSMAKRRAGAEIRRLVNEKLVSVAFDGDEDAVALAVRNGELSMSEAMNRDD